MDIPLNRLTSDGALTPAAAWYCRKADGQNGVHIIHSAFSCRGTLQINRLPPEDQPSNSDPIGNSVASDCSAEISGQNAVESSSLPVSRTASP